MILISKSEKKTELMEKYEKETGKKAIWHGSITKSFDKWKRGEKIYIDNKERIVILVTESIKNEWQEFAAKNNISTISKLLRDSVRFYMNFKAKAFDFENISDITHHLKEPLTSMKGFSELLIEDYKQELSWDVLLKIKNIFDQSLILEERIDDLSLNKIVDNNHYDILIVDDDYYTLRFLTDFFQKRSYKCKQALRGFKALELLERDSPKLILLDTLLPDISGYEVCKIIKSKNKLRNIPVYFITGVTFFQVHGKIIETGADGFFLKPFKLSDFNILFKYL